MYKQTKSYNHNEIPAALNLETGEIREMVIRHNNIPEGKGKLDYEKFHIKNDKLAMVALVAKNEFDQKLLSYEDLGIIDYMCSLSEFGTNSLKPLNNDTPKILLAEKFGISRNRVKSVLDKLFKLGVYLQISYYSNREDKEVTYWVLNPYISWKGRIKDDSIFSHFKDSTITKLLKNA